jgi:hypothetical protein
MSASVDDGARFLRQRMLAEVGDAGQARLRAALVRLDGGSLAARAHAADYLARAGVSLTDELVHAPASDATQAGVASREQTVVLAVPPPAPPALGPAADLLVGALAAVEAVKHALGVGQPAHLPPDLLLLGDD